MPESAKNEESGDLAALLDAFQSVRNIWADFHPPGPARRGDFMLLGALLHEAQAGRPVTVSALARLLHQSVPAVSQRVAWLEQRGYLCRQASSRDKRTATLEVTGAGHALLEEGSATFLARLGRVQRRLGAENTKELLALLQKLQAAIEDVQQQEEKDTTC